jgi:2-amino-4-hydroxy-6-hydroxymethyldihydropteridine diphosphokinase
MNETYLLIGGNLGNRHENMEQARNLLKKEVGKIAKISSLYETAAWGKVDQPSFLNQVLLVTTGLGAAESLAAILHIEHQMGRERIQKFGPRIIDIDILFFNSDIIEEPGLAVPHPQLHLRRFTLEPMNEIAPGFIHPVLKKSISDLLLDCPDPLAVKKL